MVPVAGKVFSKKKSKSCSNRKKNYDPSTVAAEYGQLGGEDMAFYWLEKAYDEHLIPVFIKIDPAFDSLGLEPRYLVVCCTRWVCRSDTRSF